MTKIIEDDFNESTIFTQNTPVGNPLQKYYRVPGLSIKLPSNGRYNDIDFEADGTIEIYPMRSADEMLLNTPDALMSGSAVEKLLESCVPAIKDASKIVVPDLDVLLLSIRAASTGNIMPLDITCPKCKTEQTVDCDLPQILSTMVDIPMDDTVRLSDDLVVTVMPHVLSTQAMILTSAFYEQRKSQAIAMNDELSEEDKQKSFNEIYMRIASLESEVNALAVVKITTPDGTVTDKKHIREFLAQTSKTWSKKIKDKIEYLNTGIDKKISVTCAHENCDHSWDTELNFDPSSFFGQDS